MTKPRFGAIEAGGSKFLCAVGTGPDDLSEVIRFPTTDPDQTLGRVIDHFRQIAGLAAFGIASFGPLEVDETSPRWGSILSTPKPGWSNCDIAQRISTALAMPVGFDTDVNAAALGEHRWGAAVGADAAAYVTVGTGIGGGFVLRGETLHGARHPEVGHIVPRRHPRDTEFPGTCPFHGDCVEGLASGPAIKARWGRKLADLPAEHEAHEIIAWYLAQLVVAIQAFVAPERLILGGGVMQTPGLYARIRTIAHDFGAGYFGDGVREVSYDDIVCAPQLGDRAGLLGAICLAEAARQRSASDLNA
jgi:fructokinase